MKTENKQRKANAILNMATATIEDHLHVHVCISGKEDDPLVLVSNGDDETVLKALHSTLGVMIAKSLEPEKEEPAEKEK